MMLRLEDGVKAGLCVRGQRQFCAAHNIDFRDFVRHGIDVERLAGIEDANLTRALEECAKREASGGQGR